MAEWKEKGVGRIGNTAEPFDTPVGYFSRNPKRRGSFGPWRRRSSLLARNQNSQRRGRAIIEFRPPHGLSIPAPETRPCPGDMVFAVQQVILVMLRGGGAGMIGQDAQAGADRERGQGRR